MGIYQDRIFPRLHGHILAANELETLRAELVGQAVGHVLEIGAGTGTNFIYYSRAITSLTTSEPNESLNVIARRSIRHFNYPIAQKSQAAEMLTAPDQSFDSVVSTFVLCSVSNLELALNQIKRVMKPDAKFLFLERSLSADPKVAKWQRKLTPMHRMLGNGSRLDINVLEAMESAGFVVKHASEALIPRIPRAMGNLVYGVAKLPARH